MGELLTSDSAHPINPMNKRHVSGLEYFIAITSGQFDGGSDKSPRQASIVLSRFAQGDRKLAQKNDEQLFSVRQRLFEEFAGGACRTTMLLGR